MKFLDSNGLAHFWNKVKTWIGNNYLSLDGGQINGGVTIDSSDDNVLIVLDSTSDSNFTLNLNPGEITMTKLEENSDGNSTLVTDLEIHQGNIKANMFVMNEGTSTEVLIANGSVKGIGSANGIAGLDANGYVPLAQLGNLDTTVAEVVSALPTTNIKKHIYLIKDASGVTQNKYEEYIYIGDTSATYDASKWEKLGDFRATVDLANYYTKSQVDSIANGKSSTSHTHSVIINGVTKTIAASGGAAVNLGTYLTSHQSLAEYAKKNETIHELILDDPSGDTIVFNINYANGDQREIILSAASQQYCGLMSNVDKTKLDNISSGATADSAITTAEIDALFA